MNDRSRVGSRLPLASYNDTPFASLTIEVHRGAFGESAKEVDLLRTAARESFGGLWNAGAVLFAEDGAVDAD